MTPRDDHAGGQAFEVPFPWARKSLVEIVDVENYVAFGRGKATEVHQMGVTAGLYLEPGAGSVCQVGGHLRGGTSKKSKGRRDHPSVANRKKFREPALVGAEQQIDRVATILGRFPSRVRFTRHVLAQSLAVGPTLRRSAILIFGVRTGRYLGRLLFRARLSASAPYETHIGLP